MRGMGGWHWMRGVLAVLMLTTALAGTVQAGWKPDVQFGLGEAGEFAVLLLGKPSIEAEGLSKLDMALVQVYGNVGVGPYSEFDFQGSAKITGDLYLDPTVTRIIDNLGLVTGTWYMKDLAPAVQQAVAASAYWAAQVPQQRFMTLTASQTIVGQSGLNVISIRSVDYALSTDLAPLKLTFTGPAEDPASALFVVNIDQKLVLGGAAVIEGVDPSRLLINVKPGLTPVSLATGSYLGGTLLAVDRKLGPVSGAMGPLIGGQAKEISLSGGASLNPPPVGQLPAAVILGPGRNVAVGTVVQLDGSSSSSPDPERILSYRWTLAAQPAGSAAALNDATAVNPVFVPDLPGDYLVELVVDDGQLVSEPAQLLVSVVEMVREADLALKLVADTKYVYLSSPLTLTMTATNLGPAEVAGVSLRAVLYAPTSSVLIDNPACSYAVGLIECSLGGMTPLQQHVVQVVVKPSKAMNFDVLASVSSPDTVDPNPVNNEVFLRTKVLKLNQ